MQAYPSLAGVDHDSDDGQQMFVKAYCQSFLPAFHKLLPSWIAGVVLPRLSDMDGIVTLCNLAHLVHLHRTD